MTRTGSLCTGYGGLDLAVHAVLGAEPAWVADNDPGAAAILARRFPSVPNLGDITAVNWLAVEPVEILTAGFPCQDVSCAGARKGLRAGTRTGVWSWVATAIDVLRPQLVLLENVRGLLSAGADSNMEPCPWCLGDSGDESALRALGAVLGDLADLGFDAEWQVVSAADAGAPHRRERVFILAWPAEDAHGATRGQRRVAAPGQAEGGRPRADAGGPGGTRVAADPDGEHLGPHGRAAHGDAARDGAEHPEPAGGSGATAADPGSRGRGPGEPDLRAGESDTPRRALADAERDGRPGRHADGPGEADEPGEGSRAETAGRGPGTAADAERGGCDGRPCDAGGGSVGRTAARRDSDAPADAHGDGFAWSAERDGEAQRGQDRRQQRRVDPRGRVLDWGSYGPAVARWEAVLGRPAPHPTEPGKTAERLSPAFVEWMMGLPEGWVTDVPGLSRNAQLKALGNGVVPQQAALALRLLLGRSGLAEAGEAA
jgi:DNA (cytosine-5)-methyltransferase 1